MAETSIGIKLADGSFYPILGEGVPGRKRVILTTVSDNQTGAQIDLYRGNGTGISGATYIGTLVIDEIEPAPKGSPEIELIMKIDIDGNLDAQASDHRTGEHQTLSVALESLSGEKSFNMPEFDLEERYQPDLGVSPAEESRLTSEHPAPDFQAVEDDVRRERRRRTMQQVGIVLLALVIVAVIVLLVLWLTRRPSEAKPASQPTATSQPATGTQAKPPAPAAAAKPASSAPAPSSSTPSPSTAGSATPSSSAAGSSKPSPPAPAAGSATQHQGGVNYEIRWGDTLWDLSISFYRTPWLYGKIAKANNIKNPNLIFAQTQIYIPER